MLFLTRLVAYKTPVSAKFSNCSSIRIVRQTSRQVISKKKKKKKEKLKQKEKRVIVDILSVAPKSGGFTEENLLNQMMTFLTAGHEATDSLDVGRASSLPQPRRRDSFTRRNQKKLTLHR